MIVGYVGWIGAGKTLGMVADALDLFRRSRIQVFANMVGLRFPGAVYVEDLEAITRVGSGVLLLDEAGLCLSSRYWQKVSRDVLSAFAQVRKNGLEMRWTSQHEARVDTVLRELTQEVRRCRRYGSVSLQTREDPVAKDKFGRRLVRLRRELFDLYDTLEVITYTGGGGAAGPIGGGIEIPRTVRKRSDRRPQEALTRPPFAVRSYRWLWLTQTGRLSKEAASVSAALVRSGHIAPGNPGSGGSWLRTVADEVRRRRWLRVFGLTADDVPDTCTIENPWAAGWSPSEVLERRRQQDIQEAEELLHEEEVRRQLRREVAWRKKGQKPDESFDAP